jgi:hypothetical protein
MPRASWCTPPTVASQFHNWYSWTVGTGWKVVVAANLGSGASDLNRSYST